MASTKTTYRTTHPSSDREFTVTKGGRPVRWITWADFGDGFVHAGYSTQEEYQKAVRAPRSSNPHAQRYEATAATVVETEQPAGPPHAHPAPTAQKAFSLPAQYTR
ncbi:hypothetical protein [Streptomyces microflavus]|uniref:hypothetical protein n=1 Tax=Streptomyces microflavus TaxID=1919 RepID=UPI0036A8F524